MFCKLHIALTQFWSLQRFIWTEHNAVWSPILRLIHPWPFCARYYMLSSTSHIEFHNPSETSKIKPLFVIVKSALCTADSYNFASYMCVCHYNDWDMFMNSKCGQENISTCLHPLANYPGRLTFCVFPRLTSLTFSLIKRRNCNYNLAIAVKRFIVVCTGHSGLGTHVLITIIIARPSGPPQKLFISARPWCNSSSKCFNFVPSN